MNLHSAFQTICSAVETTLSACGGGDVPARWMVACSGGMDSVVLLHAARKVLGPDHCLVAHLDHGLRGSESEADAAWVTSLALELAPRGILANAIAPGFVDTPMSIKADGRNELDSEWFLTNYIRYDHLPLKRAAQPEEIAGVAWFLAGPDASYITGSVITVDGGLTITF